MVHNPVTPQKNERSFVAGLSTSFLFYLHISYIASSAKCTAWKTVSNFNARYINIEFHLRHNPPKYLWHFKTLMRPKTRSKWITFLNKWYYMDNCQHTIVHLFGSIHVRSRIEFELPSGFNRRKSGKKSIPFAASLVFLLLLLLIRNRLSTYQTGYNSIDEHRSQMNRTHTATQ